MSTIFYYIQIFLYAVLGLGVLVFIHEFGHFIGAKIVKIPVEKFSIGWGKAIWKKQIGETTFQVGYLLIIGGFCKMKGQDDFAKEDPDISPDSFYGKPAWARLVAVIGGPLFSYLFAILLFSVIYMSYGKWDLKYTRIAINPGDAQKYKLRNGDIITHVNNEKVRTWTELKKALINNSDKKIKLKIKRGTLTVNTNPINSYSGFFTALSKVKDNPINISETFKNKVVFHNQALARIAKPFKDIMIYTEEHPSVNTVSSEAGMPAHGKLFKGDKIISINNHPVFQFEELVYFINNFKKNNPNSVPVFEIYRKGLSKIKKSQILNIMGSNWSEIDKYFTLNSDKTYRFKKSITDEEAVPLKLRLLFRHSQSGRMKIAVNPVKKNNRYIIGIQIVPGISHLAKYKNHQSIGFFKSWALGFKQTNSTIYMNIIGIIKMIRGDIPVKGSVGGPIRIFSMLGKMGASQGFGTFINFVAIISALLAFANMLPIPAVDGSHVILSIIEIIRRKDFSPKFIRRFQTIGLVTIIALLLIVTWMDIFSFF